MGVKGLKLNSGFCTAIYSIVAANYTHESDMPEGVLLVFFLPFFGQRTRDDAAH